MELVEEVSECGTEFDLSGDNPENNNLGGKGPLQGPEEMRYKDAATIDGHHVDLVMRVAGDYTPGMADNSGTGTRNGFGAVSIAAGTDVQLEFALEDSSTGAPVTVDEFSIWIYDLDMGKRGRGKESVSVCGWDSLAALDTAPYLKETAHGDCTDVEATRTGTKRDNPTDRNALTDEARKRAMKVTWSNTNKANVKSTLGAGGDGRVFMFTATAMMKCPTTTTTTTTTTPPYSTPKPRPVDPTTNCQDGYSGGSNCSLDEMCEKGVEMQFFKYNIVHNNLGGLGPEFNAPPVLQYTKVAQHHDRDLDLIVTASHEYKDQNWNYRRRTGRSTAAAYNGVAGGGAGGIFSMAPLTFDVTFKLVWTDTQEPAVIPHWMMTYYDLDGNYESVGTWDAESVAVYKNTAMQGPGCSNGFCMMKGARAEYREPSSWDNLAPYYKQDAVTFVFKNKSEGRFQYKSTYYHRMWFFKGSKALACGD